jgi:hypothetical protein
MELMIKEWSKGRYNKYPLFKNSNPQGFKTNRSLESLITAKIKSHAPQGGKRNNWTQVRKNKMPKRMKENPLHSLI